MITSFAKRGSRPFKRVIPSLGVLTCSMIFCKGTTHSISSKKGFSKTKSPLGLGVDLPDKEGVDFPDSSSIGEAASRIGSRDFNLGLKIFLTRTSLT